MSIDIKGLLSKIGLGAATAGAAAANVMTGGMLTPLTNTLVAALGKAIDPTAKAQLDLAVASAQQEMQEAEWKHTEAIATIAQQDVASARLRQSVVKDTFPTLLASVVTLGFFGLIYAMAKYTIPPDNQRIFDILIGAIAAAWASIIAYYFGSSSGSASKSETIDKIVSIQKEIP